VAVAGVAVGVVVGQYEKGKSLVEEVVADGSSPAGMSMGGTSSSLVDSCHKDQTPFGLADTGEFVDGIGIEGNLRIELGSVAGLFAKKEGELRSKCRDWGRTEG
jgi:hypothetical protein